MQSKRWYRFPDSEAVAGEAVRRILEAAQSAIESRGLFRIVLAGGSTPMNAYRLLTSCKADWSRWHVYLGDERCLPADHVDRNSVMVSEIWVGQVPIPAGQIHWIPAELGPRQGAQAYEHIVRAAIPFDLVLLGMGEDGHTASLFPGQAYDPEPLVVPVTDAPKPPAERVSLNYAALGETRAMLLLVTGSGKREAVQCWRAGDPLPVARLVCAAGIEILLDEDAWSNFQVPGQ